MSSLFYVIDTVILIGQYSSFFAAHENQFNASICLRQKYEMFLKRYHNTLCFCVFSTNSSAWICDSVLPI